MRQQEHQRECPRESRERRARRRARDPRPLGRHALSGAGRRSAASVRRSSQSAASARTVSATVSTMASESSPLRRVATICVVITRKPPPKMYGALNEASDVMNVSSAAPASAGRSSGSITRSGACASARRPDDAGRLEQRGIETREPRPGEEVEVHVHRVARAPAGWPRRPPAATAARRVQHALAPVARRTRSRRRGRGRRSRPPAAAAPPAAPPAAPGPAGRETRSAQRGRRAGCRSAPRARRWPPRSRGCPRAPATRLAGAEERAEAYSRVHPPGPAHGVHQAPAPADRRPATGGARAAPHPAQTAGPPHAAAGGKRCSRPRRAGGHDADRDRPPRPRRAAEHLSSAPPAVRTVSRRLRAGEAALIPRSPGSVSGRRATSRSASGRTRSSAGPGFGTGFAGAQRHIPLHLRRAGPARPVGLGPSTSTGAVVARPTKPPTNGDRPAVVELLRRPDLLQAARCAAPPRGRRDRRPPPARGSRARW